MSLWQRKLEQELNENINIKLSLLFFIFFFSHNTPLRAAENWSIFVTCPKIIDWREVLSILLLLLAATKIAGDLINDSSKVFFKIETTKKFQINLDFKVGRLRLALK